MKTARSPIPYELQELDHLYKTFSMKSDTEKAIHNHLNPSIRAAEMARAIAVDIEQLNSPLTQNIIDMYHRSGSSWDEFKANNALNDLGKQTSAILGSYQNNFTRTIYGPLSSYLQQPHLLKGDPNILLNQLSAIYNHLQTRYIPPKCCLQINVRSQHTFKNRIYSQDFMPRFAAKESMFTDMSNIQNRMRESIRGFKSDSFCYMGYEILTDGKIYQIFANDKTVPDCSIQHPLCKIYNATQTVLPNELDAKAPGLITVAFLADNDGIRVYLLHCDGIQLHGTRIFKEDLLNTVPRLFENGKLTSMTKAKLDELQFEEDQMYIEYFRYLGGFDKISAGKGTGKQKDSGSLADRLPIFIEHLNVHHDDQYELNLMELSSCFNRNRIDAAYIKKHRLREFRELLRAECGVTAGVASKLWRYLGGFGDENISVSNLMIYYYDEKEDEDQKDNENEADEVEYDPMEEVEFFRALLEMYPEYRKEEIYEISQEFEEMVASIKTIKPDKALEVQVKSKDEIEMKNMNDQNISNDPHYGSYNYYANGPQQAANHDDYRDYDDESLSVPWSDDEQEEVQKCPDDNYFDDDDNESEMESEDGLSLPPEWNKDQVGNEEYQQQQQPHGFALEYGESLSTPSEWEEESDYVDINVPKQPSYPPLDFAIGTLVYSDYNSNVWYLMFSHQAMANFLIIRYLLFYDVYRRFLAGFYPRSKY